MTLRSGILFEFLELPVRRGRRLGREELVELLDLRDAGRHLRRQRDVGVRLEAQELRLLLLEGQDLVDERRVLLARARYESRVQFLA
jgi:hypothetical protein